MFTFIQRTLFGNVVVNMHCCIYNNTATKTDNLLYVNIDQILPNKLHGPMHYKIGVTCVLYENIDQIFLNKLHGPMHYKIGVTCVLYENIDQILPNKLHGTVHYKIGVTCVYNGQVFCTVAMTRQSYPPISQFNSP